MKDHTNDYEILARVYGTAHGLYWLPLFQSLGHEGANRVAEWQVCYERRGLPFGGDRATVEALRKLTAAGLLATSGATQGKSWRLTTEGMLTVHKLADRDPASMYDLLKTIERKQTASKIMLPGTGRPLVMGWELCAGCGLWMETASASDAAWKKYQDKLIWLSDDLAPLLVMGFAMLFTDCGGRLWGATITDAGRNALRDWPTVPNITMSTDSFCDSYGAGLDTGVAYAQKNPPAEFQNIIARLLPASKWI